MKDTKVVGKVNDNQKREAAVCRLKNLTNVWMLEKIH